MKQLLPPPPSTRVLPELPRSLPVPVIAHEPAPASRWIMVEQTLETVRPGRSRS